MSDRDAFRAEQREGGDDLADAKQRVRGALRAMRSAAEEGCVCCGTHDNLMWQRGEHPLAVATVCRPCKFGACEVCRGE